MSLLQTPWKLWTLPCSCFRKLHLPQEMLAAAPHLSACCEFYTPSLICQAGMESACFPLIQGRVHSRQSESCLEARQGFGGRVLAQRTTEDPIQSWLSWAVSSYHLGRRHAWCCKASPILAVKPLLPALGSAPWQHCLEWAPVAGKFTACQWCSFLGQVGGRSWVGEGWSREGPEVTLSASFWPE